MSYEHAAHLLNPLRKFILSPKKLVKRLELRENSKVLELGPGPGYFSLEIARSIPPQACLCGRFFIVLYQWIDEAVNEDPKPKNQDGRGITS
jgi:hypothetical protein